MTETPNYHRIRQFGRIFIEFYNGNLVLAIPPKDGAVDNGNPSPFSTASFASFESKETTHVLLDALRWIEIIASMSIPALSNPTMISWLVTTSSTEKVRECYFPILAFCPSNFDNVNATFWKLWPACWRSLITPGSSGAWTHALVEFSGGELVDEQEKI